MTIFEGLKELKRNLITIYDNREANTIANILMEKITGLSQTQRLINKSKELSGDQLKKLSEYQQQLMKHKPVQYVLNEAWFAGMKFYVDENVLIPRPETEELVDLIYNDLKKENLKAPIRILDIGTGSGCIIISLKKKLDNILAYGLDINLKAIEIAYKNALSNYVDIEFFAGDILNTKYFEQLSFADVIVSNPPYITFNEQLQMQPNVLLFEPGQALFVPNESPLIFYEAIISFSLINLEKNGGRLYFEINEEHGHALVDLLQKNGFSNVSLKKDFQEKDRMLSAILKQ